MFLIPTFVRKLKMIRLQPLLILVLLGLALSTGAQQVPSSVRLKSIEKKYNQEAEMYQLVNEANNILNEGNSEKAVEKLQEALKLSFLLEDKRGEVFCYQSLGTLHFKRADYSSSVNYFTKALRLFKKLDENSSYYKTLRYLANAETQANQVRDAIQHYEAYLNLAQSRQARADETYAKEQLGILHFNDKNYQKANAYFNQLVVVYKASNNQDKLLLMYDYLGRSYAGLDDTTQAMEFLELAGKVETAPVMTQRNSYENVGRSYNTMGKHSKSVEFNKKAKKISVEQKDYSNWMSNNQDIANSYILMNKADEAIPYLQENIDLAKEVGEVQGTGETYKALSEAYIQLGNVEQAKNSFKTYVKVQEDLLAKKEKELNEKALENASFADKENQIALLIKDKELDEERIQLLEEKRELDQAQVEQQRTITYVLSFVLLLVFAGLIFFYRSYRQKQIANKLLSIRSLRSQMNPHFIFNSLNSVNSFISKSDERSANKYLSEFARLMRSVLEHSKHDFVLLSDELEVLDRYLRLEHLRFESQFDYELTIDASIESNQLLIPPMLVQPYVENAIWHGLRYKQGKGLLQLSVLDEDQRVRIVLEDDGIGREESKRLKTQHQKQGKSTGIKNTTSRLELLNEVHQINISCTISDLNDDGSGTRVELIMPKLDVNERDLELAI